MCFITVFKFSTMCLFISCTLADYFCHPVLGKQWEHINNKGIWITMHVPDPRLRKGVHGSANHSARPVLAKLGKNLYESILEKYVHETMQSFIPHIQDCDLYPKNIFRIFIFILWKVFFFGGEKIGVVRRYHNQTKI